jgi:hypothetical protein
MSVAPLTIASLVLLRLAGFKFNHLSESAGYRRIELVSKKGTRGEFRCLLCDHVLEVLDGSTDVSIRLTVQPELNGGATRSPD